jgi:LAO/AO transport system kinase
LTGDGIAELWTEVCEHRERMSTVGALAARRREQQVKWMWAMLEERVTARLKSDPALRARLPKLEAAVAAGRTSPAIAVDELAKSLGLS